MTASLEKWMGEADALRQLEHFKIKQTTIGMARVQARLDDYYIALAGELLERMRIGSDDGPSWARLGNAFAQLAADGQEESLAAIGIQQSEALLFSATAFYCGGFPASAYITMRSKFPGESDSETFRACFDLIARPGTMRSRDGAALAGALRSGNMEELDRIAFSAKKDADSLLFRGPDEWIPARLYERLVDRFLKTNIRAVLPNGRTNFWDPLVSSFLNRKQPAWEFFPSQIEAIDRGLLERSDTFSLQMPTGAGKTALCETLLYWHAKSTSAEVAVFLVPYRSLASELRVTLVKRLNKMGILARCAYGGTVPSGDEVQALDDTRVLVATPEALSGLLGADNNFFRRISLVICDEGHLLDGVGRGVGLELLLARMKSREGGPPR